MTGRRHGTGPRRAAYTLLELLISISLTAIVMGGLTSAILIASLSVGGDDGPVWAANEAEGVLSDIAADLKLGVGFEEADRTATTVRFTVADRDDDGALETIHYAWSGTVGDPLTRALNDGEPVVVAEDVHRFDLAYDVTLIAGTGGTDQGAVVRDLDMLLVVQKPEALKAQETVRKILIESWGHSVTVIDDDADQAAYDEAFGVHDVVYVPENVSHADLGERLRDAPIGVASELKQLPELIDVSEDQPGSTNASSIIVDDNTHYITRPYFDGLLPLLTDQQPMLYFDKPVAPGAVGLGHLPDRPDDPVLLVVEAGAPGYSGEPIPARRVIMPWSSGFDVLGEIGQVIMRRSLEWAAEAEAIEEDLSSALFSQLEDPAVADNDHEVKYSKWAVASLVPDVPDAAVSWRPTRVRFLARQKDDPLSSLSVQLRGRGFDGQPTSLVLAQITIHESALPIEYGWVEVSFSGAGPLAPEEGICVSIGTNAGDKAAEVLYEGGFGVATESNQFWWGVPGDWDTNVDRDMPCELYGTVQTAPE